VLRTLCSVVLTVVGVVIGGYGLVLLIAIPQVCDTDCPGTLELSALVA
jgi:hypothetical protein